MERGGAVVRLYTLAEARLILSHVYCVAHVPDDGGAVYQWAPGAGEALCAKCSCREPADLRLYVASEEKAKTWLEKESAAVAAYLKHLAKVKP